MGEGGVWVQGDVKRRDSRTTAPSKDDTGPCGSLLSSYFFFFVVGPNKICVRFCVPCLCVYTYISSFMYTIVLKPKAAV